MVTDISTPVIKITTEVTSRAVIAVMTEVSLMVAVVATSLDKIVSVLDFCS